MKILEAEKDRASAVIAAEKELQVADLDRKTAIAYKDSQLQRAEGDATYKRKVMEADGALAPKLDAYIEVNKIWAGAFAAYKGTFVPQIIMGGSQNGQSNTAQDFMNMMMLKTSKDLLGDAGGMAVRQK